MAEADALVDQINAGFLEELEETHRMQFEQCVQRLKSIKSTVEAEDKTKQRRKAAAKSARESTKRLGTS